MCVRAFVCGVCPKYSAISNTKYYSACTPYGGPPFSSARTFAAMHLICCILLCARNTNAELCGLASPNAAEWPQRRRLQAGNRCACLMHGKIIDKSIYTRTAPHHTQLCERTFTFGASVPKLCHYHADDDCARQDRLPRPRISPLFARSGVFRHAKVRIFQHTFRQLYYTDPPARTIRDEHTHSALQ